MFVLPVGAGVVGVPSGFPPALQHSHKETAQLGGGVQTSYHHSFPGREDSARVKPNSLSIFTATSAAEESSLLPAWWGHPWLGKQSPRAIHPSLGQGRKGKERQRRLWRAATGCCRQEEIAQWPHQPSGEAPARPGPCEGHRLRPPELPSGHAVREVEVAVADHSTRGAARRAAPDPRPLSQAGHCRLERARLAHRLQGCLCGGATGQARANRPGTADPLICC